MTVADTKTTAGMPSARRQQFESDLAQVRIRTGAAAGEARLVLVGCLLMAVGASIALIAFIVSGSQSDTRDVLSSAIIAVFGLSLVIAGAAVFLRYSMGRFLRFWLLRLIYEQQDQAPVES